MRPLDAWAMPLGGTTLLEASAGTGKTYTLTTLYLRMLVEQALHPRQILVVTYTQAATAELRERIRARIHEAIAAGESAARGEPIDPEDREAVQLRTLGERARSWARETGRADPLRRALQGFDEAAIFTIHGFCQRTLQENAFESGLAFDAELVEASAPLERALVHDLFQRLIADQPAVLIEWLLAGDGHRWQFEPESLHKDLLERLGADEAMPIVPPRPHEEEPLETAAEDLAIGLQDWAKCWGERRETVSHALLEDEGLNRNRYKKETIETRWLPELDRLKRTLDATTDLEALAAVALPECLRKLTDEAIEAGAKKNAQPLEDVFFEATGRLIEALDGLDAARNTRALLLRHRFVEEARRAGRRRREERHLLFFDDLLSELRDALVRSPDDRLARRLRERFRFALIDEFQDTDPIQYEIFRRIWHAAVDSGAASRGERGLVLIGDPKQAIYSFRGADVFTYLEARQDAGKATYELQTNWRSDPGLIEAVNSIFSARADAFSLEAIDFHPVHPRRVSPEKFVPGDHPSAALRVLLAERPVTADGTLARDGSWPLRFGRTVFAEAVAADVAALLSSSARLDGRPIAASDVAILCRRKRELAYMRRALEAKHVPCVDRGEDDVFETREAWELCCVLRAMMRPGDPRALRTALATGAHGLDAAALLALEDEASGLAALSDRYAEYGRLWSRAGFARAFESWRREEGVAEILLAYRDGDRRLTNWLHLGELLQRRASERGTSRQGLVAWLEQAIVSPEVRHALGKEASLLRLERDDEAVSLVTLHRSKGLEYPIVYLPSLWEGPGGAGGGRTGSKSRKAAPLARRGPPIRYHDAGTGRRTLDLSGHPDYPDHVDQSEHERFSEQLRLLYVGLTRARHQCVLAWGAIGRDYGRSPLAWLLHGASVAQAGEPDPTPDRDAVTKIVKAWSDEDWRRAWTRLAGHRDGASFAIEPARLEPQAKAPPSDSAPRPLVFCARTRTIPRPIRTTSFSAMLRDGVRERQIDSIAEITGRDLDTTVDLAAATPGEPDASDRRSDLAGGMHDLPRGAEIGTLLHEVLEQVDFCDPAFQAAEVEREGGSARSVPMLVETAERALERSGLGAPLLDAILHVVDAVATTPLRDTPDRLRLADLAPGAIRPEMEFTLAAPGAGSGAAFEPGGLARLLATAPPGSPIARYAERVARLGFPPLEGYVRGFIDAVLFDGQRYYLIDYKSNHLGKSQRDYRPEALVEPMLEHDYVLQYLLYAVALDRHLATRLEGYEFDRHFGGVYYLFLRGLSKQHAPGCGVFFDRPDEAVVRGISRLLGEARESFA